MKFKKIEISAFRIYDDPKNATFDFTINDGEVADFVSLYAPNGFGKTSFYDAVEWGVTNNIQRFWQNATVVDKAIDALKEVTPGQVKLWRHTDSIHKTYVQIENEKSEITKRELNIDGRSTIDAKKEGLVNKEFRKVVLSQEWISAFLKEINGEQRYKIFMENPDLKDLDSYYKSLKILVTVCKERIDALEENIEKNRAQIITLEDSDLLTTINSTIAVINNYNYNISQITLEMTPEQVLHFKNKISDILVSINNNSYSKTLETVPTAKIGSNSIIGAERYFEIPVIKSATIKEIEKLQNQIDQLDKLNLLTNELNKVIKNREYLHSKLDQLNAVLTNLPEFHRINTNITNKRSEELNISGHLKELNENLEKVRRVELEYEAEISFTFKLAEESKQKLEKIPTLIDEIQNAEKRISELLVQESNLTEENKKHDISLAEINAHVKEYSDAHKILSSAKRDKISLNLTGENGVLISNINERNANISKIESQLQHVDEQIKQNENLNKTLEDFIKKGLEIVYEVQNSSCPLCNYKYDSYIELTQKISANTALNDSLKILLSQKSELTAQVINFSGEVENALNKLLEHFDVLKTSEEAKASDLMAIKLHTSNNTKEINLEIDNQTRSISNLRQELEGEDPDRLITRVNNILVANEAKLSDTRKKLEDLKNQLAQINRDIELEKSKVVLLKEEISALEELSVNKIVKEWFAKERPGLPISEIHILNIKEKLTTDLKIQEDQQNQINQEVIELQNKLAGLTRQEVSRLKSLSEQTLRNLDADIARYNEFLKNNLEISVIPVVKDDFLKLLDNKINDAKNNIERIQSVRIELERLEKYSINLLPYLQGERLKKEIIEYTIQKNSLSAEILTVLEDERDKTKSYLEKKVKDFFYINLINSIYSKIDPHPNFKSVDFKVNFDSDNPRLDIYVNNEKSEELLIPNLYFSTAQINILSLSIFLASALNSNAYNCIFIDDPIQSLDSINILSTIDLIRSIVVNQKRQIVLSTHDENFHNLLKKKMPPNLFKSKFLELETFGKVKN